MLTAQEIKDASLEFSTQVAYLAEVEKPLTLRQKQSVFLNNIAKLISWATAQGYQLTAGEMWRSDQQQALYKKQGLTKASRSKHQDRLAFDINLFINGVYQTGREAYKPLADYWKSLHPDNVAGYDWGWDANHFEMK